MVKSSFSYGGDRPPVDDARSRLTSRNQEVGEFNVGMRGHCLLFRWGWGSRIVIDTVRSVVVLKGKPILGKGRSIAVAEDLN